RDGGRPHRAGSAGMTRSAKSVRTVTVSPATTRMSRPSTSRRCHGWCAAPTPANCRCTQDLLESCAVLSAEVAGRDILFSRECSMAAETEGLQLPLYCPLVVDGAEGKAASGRRFSRENPANVREVATVAEEGTQEDARAAIDAARTAFDENAGNWIYNGKLREQVLSRTARLVRDN